MPDCEVKTVMVVMVVIVSMVAYFQTPVPLGLSPYEIVATTARSIQALYLEECSVRPKFGFGGFVLV